VALPDRHWVRFPAESHLAENFDAFAKLFDPRGANKYCVNWRAADLIERDLRFERVDLTSEGVSPHGDIEATDRLLSLGRINDSIRQQDHPGARAICRHSFRDSFAQRLKKLEGGHQAPHRSRLAAGQNQRINGGKLTRTPNGYRFAPEFFDCGDVLAYITLERKNSDY